MKLANLDRLLGEGNFHWVYSLRDNHQLAVKIAKQRNGQMGREVKVLSALEYSNLFPKVNFSLPRLRNLEPSVLAELKVLSRDNKLTM